MNLPLPKDDERIDRRLARCRIGHRRPATDVAAWYEVTNQRTLPRTTDKVVTSVRKVNSFTCTCKQDRAQVLTDRAGTKTGFHNLDLGAQRGYITSRKLKQRQKHKRKFLQKNAKLHTFDAYFNDFVDSEYTICNIRTQALDTVPQKKANECRANLP